MIMYGLAILSALYMITISIRDFGKFQSKKETLYFKTKTIAFTSLGFALIVLVVFVTELLAIV
ncbi:hypothetical protein [Pontibacillus yanchengensis]|nr:hypothetical protein [Pontibacillus yanchengensis]